MTFMWCSYILNRQVDQNWLILLKLQHTQQTFGSSVKVVVAKEFIQSVFMFLYWFVWVQSVGIVWIKTIFFLQAIVSVDFHGCLSADHSSYVLEQVLLAASRVHSLKNWNLKNKPCSNDKNVLKGHLMFDFLE